MAAITLTSAFLGYGDFEHKNNSESRALEKASKIVSENKRDLDLFFADSKKPNTPSFLLHHAVIHHDEFKLFKFVKNYSEALESITNFVSDQKDLKDSHSKLRLNLANNKSPDQILTDIVISLKALDGQVVISDISVPARPNIQLLGTNLSIPIGMISSIGFFLSCLGLIFWFGALRLTRKREIFALVSQNFRQHLFPHLMNNTMIIVVTDSRAASGRSAQGLSIIHKTVIFLLRTTVFFLIALLTILPLIYAFIFLPFNFDLLQAPAMRILPFWAYAAIALIPSCQLLFFWAEELQSLLDTPVKILVRGRDVY